MNHNSWLFTEGDASERPFSSERSIRPISFSSIPGTYGATRRQQLSDFRESLYLAGMGKCAMPKTWSEAFGLLWAFLKAFPENEEKKVIFIDELPWMDTPKSNFVRSLDHFWNAWASTRKRPHPDHLRKCHVVDYRQCGHELRRASQPPYLQGAAATIHPQRV